MLTREMEALDRFDHIDRKGRDLTGLKDVAAPSARVLRVLKQPYGLRHEAFYLAFIPLGSSGRFNVRSEPTQYANCGLEAILTTPNYQG